MDRKLVGGVAVEREESKIADGDTCRPRKSSPNSPRMTCWLGRMIWSNSSPERKPATHAAEPSSTIKQPPAAESIMPKEAPAGFWISDARGAVGCASWRRRRMVSAALPFLQPEHGCTTVSRLAVPKIARFAAQHTPVHSVSSRFGSASFPISSSLFGAWSESSPFSPYGCTSASYSLYAILAAWYPWRRSSAMYVGASSSRIMRRSIKSRGISPRVNSSHAGGLRTASLSVSSRADLSATLSGGTAHCSFLTFTHSSGTNLEHHEKKKKDRMQQHKNERKERGKTQNETRRKTARGAQTGRKGGGAGATANQQGPPEGHLTQTENKGARHNLTKHTKDEKFFEGCMGSGGESGLPL